MLIQLHYLELKGDRLSSGHYFRNRSISNAGTFGYIDITPCMVHSVWFESLPEHHLPDWNFRANDQFFQINAATVPNIRRWPLHSPSSNILKSDAT